MIYSSPGQLDSPQALLGDKKWLGVNMRLDPALLPPGYCSEAVNMRFRHGVPETRKGTMVLPWMNRVTGGILDQEGNIIGRAGAWGTVYGQGTFSDPNTRFDYTIIAADGAVYQTTENNVPLALTLPPGVTIEAPVTFTQAYDQLVMWRGPDEVPLVMRDIFAGFDYIAQTDPSAPESTYTLPIPNASRAIFFQNRLIIPHGDDELAVSDIGDITRYAPTEADFKINKGTTDKIVSIVKFNENTLIIFKERSIYAVYNVYGDLAAIQLDTITSQYGCVAAESIVQTGADIWFLSQLGVMSLKQTELNKVQATALPISEPVQDIVERINWRYASGATAALWDSKYYLAIPVDNAIAYRDSLVTAGTPYGSSSSLDVAVTLGRCYTFKAGFGNGTLTNDDEDVEGDRMFVARSASVTLNAGGSGFSGELLPTFVGVNSIVLVYDFLNQAWSGYDEAVGVEPQKFFIAKKGNKDRLFFINKDGWVLLYEENYTDHRTEPYVDIQIVDAVVGDTVKINDGDTITVTESGSSNTSTQWYTVSPSYNRKIYYLFGDRTAATNGWGYSGAYGSAPVAWNAPDCRFALVRQDGASLVDNPTLAFDTLRVISTNGLPPVVVTTGEWATVTQVSRRQIESYIVTRGFGLETGDWLAFSSIDMDIQTWNPSVTIETEMPGFNEGVTGRPAITRSREIYDQPARASIYAESNINNDFFTPYRQDYSVIIPDDGIYVSNDGVALGVHQEARINVNAKPTSGRYTKVKITNTSGRIRVMSVRAASTVKPSVSGIHI